QSESRSALRQLTHRPRPRESASVLAHMQGHAVDFLQAGVAQKEWRTAGCKRKPLTERIRLADGGEIEKAFGARLRHRNTNDCAILVRDRIKVDPLGITRPSGITNQRVSKFGKKLPF